MGVNIPTIVIVILYILIIRQYFKLENCSKRTMTKVIGILTGVFLICWWPFVIVNLINVSGPDPEPRFIFTYIEIVNSLINPILYILLNSAVRSRILSLLTCRGKQEMEQSSHGMEAGRKRAQTLEVDWETGN